MAIRYDKKLNQEIKKIVNNYNAKIRRIEKYTDSYNYILPEKTNIKNIKQNVYTRRELRRKLNELKRYSERGIEETIRTSSGYQVSRYELANLKIEARRVRLNVSKKIKYMEKQAPKVYGKLQARTFAEMGDVKFLNLIAKQKQLNKSIENLLPDDYERFKTLVYKTGRNMEYMNSLFKENYIKMLTDLAYYTGYQVERMKLNEEQIKELKAIKNFEKANKLTETLMLNVDEKGVVTVNKIEYLKYSLSKIKNDTKFYKFFEEEEAIKDIVNYYVLTTGKVIKGFDPRYIMEDVQTLYDNLIDNIDDLMKPYL